MGQKAELSSACVEIQLSFIHINAMKALIVNRVETQSMLNSASKADISHVYGLLVTCKEISVLYKMMVLSYLKFCCWLFVINKPKK